MRLARVAVMVLLVVCMGSCRKKPKPLGGWSTEILAPLLYGSVSIDDIIADSLLTVKSNNELTLVFRSVFYRLNLAEEGISVPDTSLSEMVTLDSIKLPDRTIIYNYTLGQFAHDNSTYGPLILFAVTFGIPVPIPVIDSTSVFDQPLDATEFFETATLDSGYLDLTITNGFPIDISELIFRAKNESDGATIFIDTFYNIPVGGDTSSTYDLAGKTVDGHMLIDIIKLSSPGSAPDSIFIDTTDAITLKATVRDMKVISATAVFPAQNLVNVKNEIVYDMGGPEFTTMIIRSGTLVIEAVNTIEDSLHLRYTIPGAYDSLGQVILVNSVAPPAPTGGSVSIMDEFDLKGTTIDLTGKNHNLVNTFYNEFTARIDSTGNVISISLLDSILVSYSLIDIVPQYVKGYMGQHQVSTGAVTEPLTFFNKVLGGTFDLEQMSVGFSVVNRMGVDGTITVNQIESLDNKTGQSVALQAPFVGTPLPVKRAFENPTLDGITTFSLTESNSNIDQLIENKPSSLTYDLDLSVNPQGNKYNYQDFVNYDKTLEVSLDAEIPLSITANGLTLQDSFDFDFNLSSGASAVTGATLYFLVDNGFPLSAFVQVYFTDDLGMPIDSLFTAPSFVAPGELDNATCIVNESKRSRLVTTFNAARLDQLEASTRAIVRATLSTSSSTGCAGPLKIYSDYGLSFKLTGRFNYDTGGPS
jgi:hypothetical protein